MTCWFPRHTYSMDSPTVPVQVNCGRCMGCRLDHSMNWAIRCVHEAQMHKENSFLTLTYRNQDLPKNGSLDKLAIPKFVKRLRRIKNKEVRYYACGEYGDNFGRPHYHICMFGYDPQDKKIHEYGSKTIGGSFNSKRGMYDTYKSRELEEIWQKGFCIIGELSIESAAYVSRYITKRVTGEKAETHYNGKEPEFALMSRRPGIGYTWIQKYMTDVYPKDFLTIEGEKHKPPRYYDKIYEQKCSTWEYVNGTYVDFTEIKERRKKDLKEYDHKRLMALRKHKHLITKPLMRRFENGES